MSALLTRGTPCVDAAPALLRTPSPAAAVFARVAIFESIDAARSDWQRLEATAPVSPYQTLAWAEAWWQTRAARHRLKPCIIVAFDEAGRPTALLPFVYQARAGMRTAAFLGGQDSNANLGLFAEPERWDAVAVRRLLEAAATQARLDLFVLRNQPESWEGHGNPLLRLGGQPSPSSSRTAGLDRDLPTHLSKHARKALRQKNVRLGLLGTVEHRVAQTSAEADATIAAYVRQKHDRAETTGVAMPSESLAAFLRSGSSPGSDEAPAIELHSLLCGNDIVATLAGTGHRGRFSAMVISFDSRPAFARCSPGDLLLAALMTDLRARGFSTFDLGIGEARYKETFCDTVEPMFDTVVGTTMQGKCVRLAVTSLLTLKGKLKRSPRALSLIRRVRTSMDRIRSAPFVTRR